MSPPTEVLRRRPSDWHARSFIPIFHDHAVKVATASALRTRSFAYRHYLSNLATHGELDYAQVHDGVEPSRWEPRWLVGLARVLAFQDLLHDDRRTGLRLLEQAVNLLPPLDAAPHLEELAQLLISEARWKDAWDLVHEAPTLLERDGGYLLTDLLNPFSGSPYGDLDGWQARFGAIFLGGGYAAPHLGGTVGEAFDRLRCTTTAQQVENGPLVSVVITTFEAETIELSTSVRSILDQTYRNLEVLLIDDGSRDEFVPALKEIEALDPRIRLVRLEKNGGTYLARNAGMRLARGEFVTGQDADDWSHPERIARQIDPLLADEGLAGTRCRGITTNEHLVATRPGYSATRPNPSSLMFRREVGLAVGGFLHARKGADSEFHARLEVVSPRPVLDLAEAPLTIVRIRSGSLSRSDFKPGWTHSARRTLIDAYRHWHATAPAQEIAGDHNGAGPSIPWALQVDRPAPQHFDVVMVADFRPRTLRSAARADEIRALVKAGLDVAVLQIEDPRYQTARKDNFDPDLLELINAGRLARVSEDEAHTARLIVVRHTAPLAAPPAVPLELRAERLAIVADRLAWDPEDGLDALKSEAATARALFGLEPIWIAPTAAAREAITRTLPDAEVASDMLPETVDPAYWHGARSAPRPGVPVVGRAGVDSALTWPATLAAVKAVLPVDGEADVRVLGSARGLRAVEGARRASRSWVTFSHEEIDTRTFLSSVDFLVYEPSVQSAALTDVPVVEALASGCLVVLPPALAEPFGDAVVAAGPGEAARVVQRLHLDSNTFAARSRRAVAHVRNKHSAALATRLVRSLLD